MYQDKPGSHWAFFYSIIIVEIPTERNIIIAEIIVIPESGQIQIRILSKDPQVAEITCLDGDYDNLSIPDKLFSGKQSARKSNIEQAVIVVSAELAETTTETIESQQALKKI